MKECRNGTGYQQYGKICREDRNKVGYHKYGQGKYHDRFAVYPWKKQWHDGSREGDNQRKETDRPTCIRNRNTESVRYDRNNAHHTHFGVQNSEHSEREGKH